VAVKKLLARDWVFEVLDGVTYLEIGGIEKFSVDPKSTETDTTDFASAGHDEHLITSRGASIKLDGFHLEDPADGDRDPGQAKIEALALLTGNDSLGDFRLTSPGGVVWTFSGSAEVAGPSGGKNDPASWAATIKVSGPVTVS